MAVKKVDPKGKPATVTPLVYQDEVLATLDLPKGTMVVTRGLGSGLARRVGDPPNTIWAVGDRGPNLKVPFARKEYGVRHLRRFTDIAGAKVMPLLSVGPAISELHVSEERVTCVRTFPIRDRTGRPLGGVPVPGNFSEPAIDLDGDIIPPDPRGADTEGIVAVSDGTFWIADEYGPSLFHVADDGMVLKRIVPQGLGHWFTEADYPIVERLPAIAARRQLNRGFEALALSKDEASLFLAFQSPLAHPDKMAHEQARHVRIWQLDLEQSTVTAQFLYPLDRPETFVRDTALGEMHWSDIKVSEIVTLTRNRLLVLERGSATTKLYVVDPATAEAVAAKHLDVAERPSLEELSASGTLETVTPLSKTLLLTTDDHPEIDPDLEGVAMLNSTTLLLVNDNDFGVAGVETRFWRFELSLE